MDGTGAGGVLREAVGVPVIDRDVCASVYGDIIDVSVVCTDTSEETGACVVLHVPLLGGGGIVLVNDILIFFGHCSIAIPE